MQMLVIRKHSNYDIVVKAGYTKIDENGHAIAVIPCNVVKKETGEFVNNFNSMKEAEDYADELDLDLVDKFNKSHAGESVRIVLEKTK